jgi:hypothetical protein
MPGCLVLRPRIAEANDYLHGENLPVAVEQRAYGVACMDSLDSISKKRGNRKDINIFCPRMFMPRRRNRVGYDNALDSGCSKAVNDTG